jgi:hypothetical protein
MTNMDADRIPREQPHALRPATMTLIDGGRAEDGTAADIVRRLQAALVPSILPVGPPESVMVETMRALIGDPRIAAAAAGRGPLAAVIGKVRDILARPGASEDVADELWDALDDPALERHLANGAEPAEEAIRRMYRGPYGKYVGRRWSGRERRRRRFHAMPIARALRRAARAA